MNASLHRADNARREQSVVISYDTWVCPGADGQATAAAWLVAPAMCRQWEEAVWFQDARTEAVLRRITGKWPLQSPHSQSEVLTPEGGFFFWKRSILLKGPDFKKGLRDNLLCHFSFLCLLNIFRPVLYTFSFRLLLSGCNRRIWNQFLVHAAIYKLGKKTPHFRLHEPTLPWSSGQGLLYGAMSWLD